MLNHSFSFIQHLLGTPAWLTAQDRYGYKEERGRKKNSKDRPEWKNTWNRWFQEDVILQPTGSMSCLDTCCRKVCKLFHSLWWPDSWSLLVWQSPHITWFFTLGLTLFWLHQVFKSDTGTLLFTSYVVFSFFFFNETTFHKSKCHNFQLWWLLKLTTWLNKYWHLAQLWHWWSHVFYPKASLQSSLHFHQLLLSSFVLL